MTQNKYSILAISGSTRKNSSNEAILKYIAVKYNDVLDVTIYTAIDTLPHFNPDLDNENPPTEIQQLRKLIVSSNAVLFCTPEYVFALPGSLKNLIDWNVSTTIFSNKPCGFIIASASGEKAFEILDRVLTTIEVKFGENSKLLIESPKGKIDLEGNIIDTATIKQIETFVHSVVESIKN